MTSVPKNVYINKSYIIVNKYNNAYRSKTKMKPSDVKSNTYMNSNKEINDEDLKFKIGDIVRVSKYKNHFFKNLKEELFERFMKKNLYLYMVFTTEGLFEVAIESWPEWNLNPRPLNSVYIYIYIGRMKVELDLLTMQEKKI